MGFLDVDLVQPLVEDFPHWQNRFRWDPVEYLWQGSWFRVEAIRALSSGIELILGNRRVIRLDYDDSSDQRDELRC